MCTVLPCSYFTRLVLVRFVCVLSCSDFNTHTHTHTHAHRADDEWGGDVFLHPRSVLHSQAPEFVIYSQVVRTSKRPYMGGVTAIEVGWVDFIVHCLFSVGWCHCH